MRKQMFLLTLVVGLALVLAGFFLAAPIGPPSSPVYSNPHMPFAPVLFTLGVMMLFLSVVVYELFPDRRN